MELMHAESRINEWNGSIGPGKKHYAYPMSYWDLLQCFLKLPLAKGDIS